MVTFVLLKMPTLANECGYSCLLITNLLDNEGAFHARLSMSWNRAIEDVLAFFCVNRLVLRLTTADWADDEIEFVNDKVVCY